MAGKFWLRRAGGDIAYLEFPTPDRSVRGRFDRTVRVSDSIDVALDYDVLIDLDADNNVLGIEILGDGDLARSDGAGEHGDLGGKHIIVTAGPTHEPIDPVRYIANRSSGKQGFAIAAALAERGARVTLVAGPVTQRTPNGVTRIDVETAVEMARAVDAALPADAAVMVAAVADWRVAAAPQKLKKGDTPPTLTLSPNPDILATLAAGPQRPKLLIGFAAETECVVEHAIAKRSRKGADWIIANDVSGDVMGGDANTIHLVTENGVEDWEPLPKDAVARRLAERIAETLA